MNFLLGKFNIDDICITLDGVKLGFSAAEDELPVTRLFSASKSGEEIVIVLVQCVTITVANARLHKADSVGVLRRAFLVVRHPTNDGLP